MKKVYHAPVIETEKLFEVFAADMSILARCWGSYLAECGWNIYSS